MIVMVLRHLRTPEEIRAIITTLKEMCRATRYNIKKMPEYIRKNCSERSYEMGYRLLAEAVAPSVCVGRLSENPDAKLSSGEWY